MSHSHEKEENLQLQDEDHSSNSPPATGYISADASGRFNSTFTIDGKQYKFSGAFTANVPPFKCDNAILTYGDNIRHLTSTRSFSGQLGPTTITLNIRNGPTISGPLNEPIDPGCSISGSGVWSWEY